MRRFLATTLVAVGLAVSGAAHSPAPDAAAAPPAPASDPARAAAEVALTRASAALDDTPPRRGATRPADATLALRDLRVALPHLDRAQQRRAQGLLARPTDDRADPYGNGYRARATRSCAAHVCVHRVRRTADRASGAWTRATLRTMERVWRGEVRRLGYRRPLRDGRRGGNGKLDVYLADVGARGLYGYCAPELTSARSPHLASGYCVLDNDFSRSQFRGRPADSLAVTAGHEFFHAVQFGYDYLEDPWLMEATATWVEERVADRVDDNRQYLAHGQVRATRQPLDLFHSGRANHYGNWVFFEYLSEHFGTGVVRRIWEQAGLRRGATYSTRAVAAALPRTAPLAEVYAAFAAANVRPDLSYPEGAHWPTPLAVSRSLGADESFEASPRISHLAHHVFRLVPRAALGSGGWRLRVTVAGPGPETSPAVSVVRLTSEGVLRRTRVRLDDTGAGQVSVPFDPARTRAAWVVAANASTRFDCSGRYVDGFSCGGVPRDDGLLFGLTASTYLR